MTEKFTAEQVFETLHEIVDANPEFVYTKREWEEGGQSGCYYTAGPDEPEGSCVAGHAFIKMLGPDVLPMLRTADRRLSETSTGYSAETLIRNHDLPFTSVATLVLNKIQGRQDNGHRWAAALREVEKEHRDHVAQHADRGVRALTCDFCWSKARDENDGTTAP
jgi:hypothetical protein